MITFASARRTPPTADVVVLAVYSDRADSRPSDLDWPSIEARGFEAKPGQVQVAMQQGKTLVAVVGLGEIDKVDATAVRKAGAAVARALKKYKTIATPLLEDLPARIERNVAAQALAEGVVLGSYNFERYKSEGAKPSAIARVVVVVEGRSVGAALQTGAQIAQGVNFARDLINEPGGTLTPAEMTKRAVAMARQVGLKVTVHDEAAIKRLKLGGLLGVNRGSTNPPRFVQLEYRPPGRPKGTLALVGKGITFDSGGLSIKTMQGMMTMKCDMSGGAAVFGAMSVLPMIKPACRVLAFVPMTDNMLGGDATRPGDVLRIRNGKTVEVLNTDAEGRLILADALSLASEAKPDAIVDLATLTGACMVALGQSIAGVMGNNEAFSAQVCTAADRVGERMWQLPLPADYRKQLDSPVADLKNIGGTYGGAMTAGLFLQEFVDATIPWVHLDIAGPAFLEAEDGEHPKGGTGFGVRTLVELARTFKPA
ncbi:MAG TPA: leucyl aminopeptidase [Acidimicrobiales bacterium]|nr:leucyl aminopeptidase [Acidimicrobiales bacterium]